jgi:hypothetical protein
LFGTVNEVAPTFLGQWAVPISGEDTRLLEELIEHDRVSFAARRQPMDSTSINRNYVAKRRKMSGELLA